MRALRAVIVTLLGCTSSEPAPVTCGAGTSLSGDTCVATPLVCGTGTTEMADECTPEPLPHYQVRAERQIVADGTTPASIWVFGTNPDDTPATDELVFDTDRFGAGDFTPPIVTLDERGAVATFVPCNATATGCTGPLRITVARTSASTTPIAQFDVELIAPPSIGSIQHCQPGTNTLYLEGSGFLYSGKLTISDAVFTRGGGSQRATLDVVPNAAIQGAKWSLDFSTVPLATTLMPGVYTSARQGATTGVAGIEVKGQTPFATCSVPYVGDFQVHDYVFTTSLQHMTISFREWCPSQPTQVVSGCVHVE